MEKPKTFAIKGTELLLRAFYEELLKMGYKKGLFSLDNIDNPIVLCVNTNKICEIDEFRLLFVDNEMSYVKTDITFQLPEQFNEALTFAKEQLEHPYWKLKDMEELEYYWVRLLDTKKPVILKLVEGDLYDKQGDVYSIEDIIKIEKATPPENF